MLGGYIEIFIFMLLLMLFAFKLANRRGAGASRCELAWCWAGIGFIVGLGYWVNPLISYGIFAAALWILWDWLKALKKSISTLLLPALASIPACIVGLAPAIYWGALNHWQNITYVLQLGGNPPIRAHVQAVYHTRLSIMLGLTRLYTTCVGPRILSGELPGENAILIPLHIPTFVLSGLCILATVTLVAISFVKPHPLLLKVRKLTALPIVFASSVGVIFCLTETAADGLVSCQLDYAGRYATPLMLVIPFFVATICAVVVMLEAGSSTIGLVAVKSNTHLNAGKYK